MRRFATGGLLTKPRCASRLPALMISSTRSGRRGFFERRHERLVSNASDTRNDKQLPARLRRQSRRSLIKSSLDVRIGFARIRAAGRERYLWQWTRDARPKEHIMLHKMMIFAA